MFKQRKYTIRTVLYSFEPPEKVSDINQQLPGVTNGPTKPFGVDGSGSASATAKTSELGHDDESTAEVLEAAWREATLRPRSWWDLGTTWGPSEPLQWAAVVGLIDSASEKNKARAAVEIHLEPGVIRTPLAPFRYHCSL